ncbi:site-specific recombinase XerD [Arenicella xantha]|uniref:Site-specific recombinase XerD n=2 Tax=Arenicella xantha TaxID=644221 RepID=A0A395JNW3_9GAMM|nr:site-specific recombinase XerD [Arenicella xantha]
MMGDKSSTDKSNNDYQEFLQIEEESQHQELYEAGLIRSALSFTERYNAIAEWDALEREHLWMSMTEAERVAMEWVSSEGIDLSAYRAQTNMAVGSERHDETIQKNTNQTELLSNLAEKHSARLERKGINPRTIKLYRSYLKTFIEYVGDRQSCELTYRDVEKFVEVLPKIPTNRNNGRYQGLSIDQIIEQQFGTYNTLAKNTLKEYARTIRSFLQEFVKKGYIDPISATAIEKEFTTKEKNPYLPFDKSDLEKLFYSDEYLKGKHTKASNYWAPLLALFTGARSNEICQLLVSDIRHEKIDHRVVTYIDINEEEDKELKTPAARRVVPIHSKLIELGFLGYVETVINQGSNALFPEIKVVNGKHNHALGRWFRDTYKRKCGIEDIGKSKKVFHSFRHTAVQHLWDSQGYELSRIGELVGHTHTTITGGYTHTLSLAKKAEMIEAMDYGIDFSRIRLWRPK